MWIWGHVKVQLDGWDIQYHREIMGIGTSRGPQNLTKQPEVLKYFFK